MTTDTNEEIRETDPRPDLVWDDETPGLCLRCYGDGSQSFIFVYRINDRQHFIRIGKTPVWSLAAARNRAKKMRCVVEEGGDPNSVTGQPDVSAPTQAPPREIEKSQTSASVNRQSSKLTPVEDVMQFIAEELRTQNN
jgi:hypothetical protein